MRPLGLRAKLVVTFHSLFLVFTLVFAWYLIRRQGTIALAGAGDPGPKGSLRPFSAGS